MSHLSQVTKLNRYLEKVVKGVYSGVLQENDKIKNIKRHNFEHLNQLAGANKAQVFKSETWGCLYDI